MSRKRKPIWVASCKKLTTKKNLIIFSESLPNYITTKQTTGILNAIKHSNYECIVWTHEKNFRVW